MGKGKRDGRNLPTPFFDLWVPSPGSGVSTVRLLEGARSAGYSGLALTFFVYGKPLPEHDVEKVLPLPSPHAIPPGLKVWRRLHAVVETLSDVGHFCTTKADTEAARVLRGYDVVSISPRNEAIFEVACETATAASIITLDYTVRDGATTTSGLPFRLTSKAVTAAVERGAVLEVAYAPAIVGEKRARHNFVALGRALQLMRMHDLPILVSSGPRRRNHINGQPDNEDAGTMALRRPDDVANLLSTVLRLTGKQTAGALSTVPASCLQHSKDMKLGKVVSGVVDAYICTTDNSSGDDQTKDNETEPDRKRSKSERPDAENDGFIQF